MTEYFAGLPEQHQPFAGHVTRDGVLTLILRKVGQALCRHRWMLMQSTRPARLWMRCPDCGAETEGFEIEVR